MSRFFIWRRYAVDAANEVDAREMLRDSGDPKAFLVYESWPKREKPHGLGEAIKAQVLGTK